ncbi:MAG: sensor histidine kinase [Alloprevotella sp.]
MEELNQRIQQLQDQVKQQEKLASLGMLTAGIVHEIRNPLNFVINFSKLSKGLLKDLADDIAANEQDIDADDLADIRDIMADLSENLQKIQEHGDRAVSIIQNILLYSRGKEDEYIPTDICKLAKEYVWLSYHAMRANYPGFNISVEEHYAEGLPLLKVIPQDLSRAILNVMNNACYAVWEKTRTAPDGYRPCVQVSVDDRDGQCAITIADNGKGMTDEVKQKIFQSFFTTKPIGHGTGLGMSITRDIIENKHHGHIEFDTVENEGSRFTLFIPLKK